MPVADLPYRITRLANEGQYAYLARPAVRTPKILPTEDKPVKTPKTSSVSLSKIRVLRNVTLCDGPTLWDSIAAKSSESSEEYSFYVNLRLFASRSMVLDYLSGPELASFCSATGTPPPILTEEDIIISEADYLKPYAVEITKQEYSKVIISRDDSTTLENLEELVCQMKGIESLESLDPPKRGRKKKSQTIAASPAMVLKIVDLSPEAIVETSGSPSGSDEEEEAAVTTTTTSDRPAVQAVEIKPKPKKKTKTTLRDQLGLIQNTPSRVIDVSGFGDTMQHQKGKFLDRIRHAERISQCTSLSDLFPIVSDNLQSFERAMTTLGGRYLNKISEFKSLHAK